MNVPEYQPQRRDIAEETGEMMFLLRLASHFVDNNERLSLLFSRPRMNFIIRRIEGMLDMLKTPCGIDAAVLDRNEEDRCVARPDPYEMALLNELWEDAINACGIWSREKYIELLGKLRFIVETCPDTGHNRLVICPLSNHS